MKMKMIKIRSEKLHKDLLILKAELSHISLEETISYLFHELEKPQVEELIPSRKTKLPNIQKEKGR